MKPIYNPKYKYPELEQITQDNGIRHYVTPHNKYVPSVTTIISEMSDKSFLIDWRDRIGNEKADEITKISSRIGEHMHNNIEAWLKDEEPIAPTNMIRKQAEKLAKVIIEKALIPNLTEFWGSEVHQYYDDLYAGTCDLIGVYKGVPSIIDFKNSRKPKSQEKISGYRQQLVAYGMAHNKNYGTDIRQGVNLICSREDPYFGEMQEFIISGEEWENTTFEWVETVGKFYEKK